ncbi:hypothetical protein Q73A0000_16605 [Kaistella flava (ex Peng et al. 2021)]|uniref:Putative beta-lactamase-inhibitor-like PepSY-like domain-containing protein n=1 Tax=Kaistella flava (ex Peng et al. 2021) TaxID=2038776 RepID=A0A7M2YCN3_9FLAO|nr:PepSY-like domain-containing protein [Kaistella flava (ex Peng et al. 2021)]QOW11866.1 hypothetical protein Q73A0000_16605 [Kaistella flava (ex Peng et al. 2021)]
MKNLKLATLSILMSTFVFSSCEKKVVVQNPTDNTTKTSKTEVIKSNSEASNAEQDLPQKVKNFLTEHYAGIPISKYKVKTNTRGKEYEVKLNNGVEVEFDNSENWKDIKDYNGVPDVLVPANIKAYVNKNYKDIKIKSLERKSDKNMIKADLLNGIDLDFDMNGTFLRID